MRAVTSGSANATIPAAAQGQTVIVLETEVTRDDGKLAAKVTQTQAYLHARG